MDLDSFKEINDSHGHHVGDRALCEVARVLRAAIRPYDICVRYAGDEFIVVLSGCGARGSGAEAAGAAAEHRRGLLRSASGQAAASSASASAPRSSRTTATSYEALLATADSRMYQDKAARKRSVARVALEASIRADVLTLFSVCRGAPPPRPASARSRSRRWLAAAACFQGRAFTLLRHSRMWLLRFGRVRFPRTEGFQRQVRHSVHTHSAARSRRRGLQRTCLVRPPTLVSPRAASAFRIRSPRRPKNRCVMGTSSS